MCVQVIDTKTEQGQLTKAVEISFLRSVCDMNKKDNKSNPSANGKFGMSSKRDGMNNRVWEVVKCSILRWLSHQQMMTEEDIKM